MANGFGFKMQYTVNFERATAIFDLAAKDVLTVIEPGKPAQPIPLAAGMGYEYEIAYFIDCLKKGVKPTTVTVADAAKAVQIIEAEVKSAESGAVVAL